MGVQRQADAGNGPKPGPRLSPDAAPNSGAAGPAVRMTALALAVALLSGASLAYEVLLFRLYAVRLGHQFAAMVIALALLGIGAGGTLLALFRQRLLRDFGLSFGLAGLAFAASVLACTALVLSIDLPLEAALWRPWLLLSLAGLALLQALPFLCASLGLGLSLSAFTGRAGRLYRADLLGGGLAGPLVFVTLTAVPPGQAIKASALCGLLAALAAGRAMPVRSGTFSAILLAAVALTAVFPSGLLSPEPSAYRPLARAMLMPRAEVTARASGPMGVAQRLTSPVAPMRFAPGLSPLSPARPPGQDALFLDGDFAGALPEPALLDARAAPGASGTPEAAGAAEALSSPGRTGGPGTAGPAGPADGSGSPDVADPARNAGAREDLTFLAWLPTALPYLLLDRPRVLAASPLGGFSVVEALWHGSREVVAAEPNQALAALMASSGLFSGSRASLARIQPRALLRAGNPFDLIFLSPSGVSSAVQPLGEDFLLTKEAFEAYLGALSPDGLLCLLTPVSLPPRPEIKCLATTVAALRAVGLDPAPRMAALRTQTHFLLLASRNPFTAQAVAAMREFCRERNFDPVYHPGLDLAEANRFTVLPKPYHALAARELLGPNAAAFLAAQPYYLWPATDERPFFQRYFRWQGLGRIASAMGTGSMALVEWGYVLLAATLALAMVAGLCLVVLPLGFLQRAAPAKGVWRLYMAFIALGLAFLFLEIACLKMLTPFLGHPFVAATFTVAAFMLFAGLGSGVSRRFAAKGPAGQARGLRLAVAGITLFGLLFLLAQALLLPLMAVMPLALRAAVAMLLIAPLALAMGLPFPLGLALLEARTPGRVPWAWGLNGYASVVSPLLATLLAVHLGFKAVVLLAIGLYALTLALFTLDTRSSWR
ncbi:hypothetical protein [Desulfocurvibacter africanus]|uniref:Putative spermidine synthase n=1 Tax=Desulfocurvibacter africanus subsp. africanus str. Walvis Bay TaxID=690850 RepID=F3Z471_DESAF|nr:hypothetical protein [Desulfocurvibacter africanus]EGJ51613.1 putative spermidine synthase [Desulfocurvibacter africanus subsp. africanus str. Walvis Bay]